MTVDWYFFFPTGSTKRALKSMRKPSVVAAVYLSRRSERRRMTAETVKDPLNASPATDRPTISLLSCRSGRIDRILV